MISQYYIFGVSTSWNVWDLHVSASLTEVALQRLEEQRVELEREIQEAKDALEKLRTEAAAVEHSLLRQHWNVVSHFLCKVCIDGQMLPNLARLLGNWLY